MFTTFDFRISPLLWIRYLLTHTPIETLYPELCQDSSDKNWLYYLAHFDLALSMADNAHRFYCCQQIAFTRLNELHVLSYFQRPHYEGPPDALVRVYYESARAQFERGLAYFPSSIPCLYNRLVTDFILAPTRTERLHVYESMLEWVSKTEQYDDAMAYYKDFIQHMYQAMEQDLRLHTNGLEILSAISFLRHDPQDLAFIHLGATERAQAFAHHSLIFVGTPSLSVEDFPALPQTVDYRNANWRVGLLNCLLDSEIPDQGPQFHIGCCGPQDPAFMAEVQKKPWHCVATQHPVDLPQNLDAVTLWHLTEVANKALIQQGFDRLKANGLLVVAVKRTLFAPEALRNALEQITDGTAYLIDRESFTDVLVAYVVKAPRFTPLLKVLLVLPPYSIWTFGGFEYQVFKSRAYFKHRGICSDISLACRLDATDYDVIYVLGGAHEPYKVRYLAQVSQPKVYMPVPLIFSIEHAMSQAFLEALKQLQPEYSSDEFVSLVHQWDFGQLRNTITAERGGVESEHDTLRQVAQTCTYFIPQSLLELQLMFPDKTPHEIPHQLIYNGCEHAIFEQATPSLFKDTYSVIDFVLCVGRIEANKNQLLLCQALRDTDIPLVLIGAIDDPIYFDMCLTCSNGKVLHLQHVSNHLLASALKAAKLFILPSCSEIFPLATVEAVWAGCPVISTQCSGQTELFGDAFTYVDPFHITAMKQAILEIYQGDNTVKINKAKAIAKAHVPTWAQMADQIADVLFMQAQPKGHLFLHRNRWYQVRPPEPTSISGGLPVANEWYDEHLWPLLQTEHFQLPHTLQLVHTDATAYWLQQWGTVSVVKKTLVFPDLMSRHIPLPLERPQANALKLLALYDPNNHYAWQEVVCFFVQHLLAQANTCLLIYIAADYPSESAESQILAYLETLGPQAIETPYIVLVTGISTPELEQNLLAQVDHIVFPLKQLWGHETLWLRLCACKTSLITHEYDQDALQHHPIRLLTFEQLRTYHPQDLIPVLENILLLHMISQH